VKSPKLIQDFITPRSFSGRGQGSCGSEAGNHMKNVIISMVAKISKMDAEAKQLTARVEAQSLLLSALVLTLGKNGGVREIIENIKKAINTAVDVSDTPLKSDAEMLLSEFTDLLSVTRLLDDAESEIDFESLNDLLSNTDDNPEQT
jgi:hypothetical protein